MIFRILLLASLALPGAGICPAQLLVAHRGASCTAPENTLAAFRLAWDEGADAIEGDFHLTSDGRIVCLHDKDTRRACPQSPPLEVACRKALPQIDAHWLVGFKKDKETGDWSPSVDSVFATLEKSGANGIDVQAEPAMVDRAFAERLCGAGLAFHC